MAAAGRVVKVGSLFSGVGGIDLGLERAGATVAWQSEIDPLACRVLAKHWPNTPNLGDITLIDWKDVERVDIIAGGYPCQPFSHAGQRAGTDDRRHLWPYVADAIRHLRPRFALMENVAGHLSLGFDRVLGDLAEIGYDAQWDCLPAASVGAPHVRDRVFIVAYPHGGCSGGVDDDGGDGREVLAQGLEWVFRGSPRRQDWGPRPDSAAVRGMADELPHRVDRLRALGNAVVPAVAEHIGRRLMAAA